MLTLDILLLFPSCRFLSAKKMICIFALLRLKQIQNGWRLPVGCSLLETLSLLHYCRSCSKQCNNERALVSWAQLHPHTTFTQPACLWARHHSSTETHHLHYVWILYSIKNTLSEETVFVFYLVATACWSRDNVKIFSMGPKQGVFIMDMLASCGFPTAIKAPDQINQHPLDLCDENKVTLASRYKRK